MNSSSSTVTAVRPPFELRLELSYLFGQGLVLSRVRAQFRVFMLPHQPLLVREVRLRVPDQPFQCPSQDGFAFPGRHSRVQLGAIANRLRCCASTLVTPTL